MFNQEVTKMNGYRPESTCVGQYIDDVQNETIKTDQAVQRDYCWGNESINNLIYSAVSQTIFIPNLILAEERKKDIVITYVVDGGHRTEALRRFKYCGYRISSSIRNPIVKYNKKKLDENGEIIRDEYGDVVWETAEFDLRKKTYEDLPDELKRQFNKCPLMATIYQDCTSDETSGLVNLYNNHVGMNVSQKALTYIGKFANVIKHIKDTNRFLIDGTALTENEKHKGVWERVISECVMAVYHFNEWKKDPKKMCDYLNNNSSNEEYKSIESYFNRLTPYVDKLENKDVSDLFVSKDMAVWMIVFNDFNNFNIPDSNFANFLNAFVGNLKETNVNGITWAELDADKHTKDKSVIAKKVEYIESLMKEYLHIEDKEVENITTEEFISKVVDIPVEIVEEEIEVYKEDLGDLQDNAIKDGSKLLDVENQLSLLAMVAYAYKNDLILDDWLEDYASKNNTYYVDQSKNFKHMVKSLTDYNKRMAVG